MNISANKRLVYIKSFHTIIYRMTQIDNIPHILAKGITHPSGTSANPDYVSIGDTSLIRADIPFTFIKKFIVYNEAAKEILLDFGVEDTMVVVNSGYYF